MNKLIKGMDLSTLLEMERCGARYYDKGEEMDLLDIMKRYDIDTIRLRIWNNPKSEAGEPYGADNKGVDFFWWEPAWIPVPGSGWAAPASLEYIHDKGPCGNEWTNQALFDYDGNALLTLELIKSFEK